MSASTGTIQRPIGQGSIFGTVALAAVVLFATIAIAWGAMNLASTKSVAAPLAAPAVLDHGSRSELAPKAVLVPYAAGKAGNVTPRTFGTQQVDHTNTGRHLPPETMPRGPRAS